VPHAVAAMMVEPGAKLETAWFLTIDKGGILPISRRDYQNLDRFNIVQFDGNIEIQPKTTWTNL
jgi:hypothetical protein